MKDKYFFNRLAKESGLFSEIERIYCSSEQLKIPVDNIRFKNWDGSQVEISIQRYNIDDEWIGKIFIKEVESQKLITDSFLTLNSSLKDSFNNDDELKNNLMALLKALKEIKDSEDFRFIVERGEDHSINPEIWDRLYSFQKETINSQYNNPLEAGESKEKF